MMIISGLLEAKLFLASKWNRAHGGIWIEEKVRNHVYDITLDWPELEWFSDCISTILDEGIINNCISAIVCRVTIRYL